MANNYYAILGVLPSATPKEIRSAYRRRAKQYHPDQSGEDSTEFLILRRAYDVLRDPAERRSYDRTLRSNAPEGIAGKWRQPGFGYRERPPVEPLRDERRSRGSGRVPPVRPIESLRPSLDRMPGDFQSPYERRFTSVYGPGSAPVIEIQLDAEEARLGGAVRIMVPVERPCAACVGIGDLGVYECVLCGGTGTTFQRVPLDLELPPGIPDSCEVVVPLDGIGLPGVRLILVITLTRSERI